jgi:hypothetical protein
VQKFHSRKNTLTYTKRGQVRHNGRKKEEGRRKKEEGRGKREEGRGKRVEGRG